MINFDRDFDIDKKNKCPQCGTDMDYLYGRWVCTKCGYSPSHVASGNMTTKNTVSTPRMKEESNSIQVEHEAKKHRKKKSISVYQIVLGIIIVLLVAISFLNTARGRYGIDSIIMEDAGEQEYVSLAEMKQTIEEEAEGQFEEIGSLEVMIDSEEISEEITGSQEWSEEVTAPIEQSEGMKLLVEQIFQKDYDMVTQGELGKITYLDLDYDYQSGKRRVEYALKTAAEPEFGEDFEVELESDASFENTDFSIFSNLGTLYMDYGSIGSLNGLNKLCVLGTDLTPNEIKRYINPLQFISLTLYDLTSQTSLSGLEDFKNLTSLYLYANTIENIDALGEIEELRNLGLYYADQVTDFQVLYDLHYLEYLSLESSKLDKLDFVENMPRLYSLTIWNCVNAEASEWNHILEKTKLRRLILRNCYIPCSSEMFLQIPNLEKLALENCVTGFDVDNLPDHGKMEELDFTDTTFYKAENGTWKEDANMLLNADEVEEAVNNKYK